jgi:hypothetical protein
MIESQDDNSTATEAGNDVKRQLFARGGYTSIANCQPKLPAKFRGVFGFFFLPYFRTFAYALHDFPRNP